MSAVPFTQAQLHLHEIATRMLMLTLLDRQNTDVYRVLQREFEARRARVAEAS